MLLIYQAKFKAVVRLKKWSGHHVAKHVKKHVKLGEDMSEIEKAILAEICADCSIRISQFPTALKFLYKVTCLA